MQYVFISLHVSVYTAWNAR